MIYYKQLSTGDVYAYESEQERKEWGAPDLVEMTKKEIDEHLNPTPTPEQLADQARAKRDALLSACDWTQVSDAPVDQEEWATYRQALRDVPAQAGFPETINWPTPPNDVS